MKKIFFLFFTFLMLTAASASAYVWPRTYGPWDRLNNGGTVTGTIKVPVIFISFSQTNSDDEYVISTTNQTAWMESLNGTTGYGASQYFNDMSYGNVNVQFVKVGSYTASGKSSTYSSTYTDLVSTAVQGVNYSDWSNFDSNNDGFVDMVLLIFAGHADGDYTSGNKSISGIYPRSGWLDFSSNGNGTTISGVSGLKWSRYLYVNDLASGSASRDNLATALHELGHALFDLPDYYNSSSGSPSYGSNMGYWDTMDYGMYFKSSGAQGVNAVPGLSAYSRMLNGWVTPRELTYGQHVTLRPLNEYPDACMIKTVNDNVYYILEARHAKSGSWDDGLASGLILTYVNEANTSSFIVNHNSNNGTVKVVRADGTTWTDSNYSSSISTQPYGPNVKSIPSSVNSIFATKTVENITVNSDGSVEFDFMGGATNVCHFEFANTSVDMTMGGTQINPLSGTPAGYDGQISYASNNSSVATVNAATGQVTAVGVGTATITVTGTTTANFEGGTASYTVIVREVAQDVNSLADGTIVTLTNYYGLGNLVNDNGTIKALGGSQAAVDAAFSDGRGYNTAYATGFDKTNANHLWQVMTNEGQKYLVNVGTGKTVSVANPTVLATDPSAVTFTAVNGLSNVYAISTTANQYMSASVFTQNVTNVASNYSPNSSTFSYTVDNYDSSQTLRITADLSNCSSTNENVLSLGNNISAWDGAHVHMYYTKSTKQLLVWFLNNVSSGGQNKTITLSSNTLTVELNNNTLTVNGTAITTSDYAQLAGLTGLSTIEVGSTEGATRSKATNYNISVLSGENSQYPVSATSQDASTAWAINTVTNSGITPLTTQQVFGGEVVTPDPEDPDEPAVDTAILWDGNSSNKSQPASRIPALVKTNDGSLLAFSDVRYNRMDIGQKGQGPDTYRIDLQMRRSTDGGSNWSAPVTIAEGNANCGYGDASVVADNASGKVLMMCAAGNVSFPNSTSANPIKIHKFVSNDNGQNWTDKGDITDYIYNSVLNNASKAFFSSGKMTQGSYRKPGAQYNRIYVSLVTANGSQVAYSDDFGDTWAILGNAVAQSAGDEAHVVELPNGDILLVGRAGFTETKRYVNLFTYTNKETGAGSWGTQGQVNGTTAAGCHGDIDLVPALKNGNLTYLLLQSAPTTNAPRRYVTYYYKELADADSYSLSDFTSGWTQGLQVYGDASAYSSLRYLGDGVEAILYEKAETNYSGGASASNDPNPAGYDITFTTNTIAEITNNAFSTEEGDLLTYIYTDSENSSVQLVGEYVGTAGVTTPSVTLPDYCVVSGGTWEGNVYKATVTASYPFTPSTSSTEYYYFVHSSNNNGATNYWMSTDAGVTFNATEPTDLDNGTWAFVGSWATGFAIKNRAGFYMYTTEFVDATTSDNGTQIGLSATNRTIYDLVVETYDNNVVGEFKVGSHYLSFYSSNKSYLSYYGSNHAGIRFYFTESETVEVEEPEEGVVGKVKMGVKQIETTSTVTYYQKTTTAPTKGSSTTFLIMSANTYWAMCDDASKSVAGPGNTTADYDGDVNVSGKPYTFTWTSQGYLLCSNGKYLNRSNTSLSFDSSGSTVWNIAKSAQNIRISTGSGRNTYYITSPSANAGAFTASTTASNISFYTAATKQGTVYEDAAPLPFSIKAEYATLYSADAYKMPGDDLVGYFIEDATAEGGELNPREVYHSGDIVPAGTSLLLHGTQGNYSATLYEEKVGGTETCVVYDDSANQLEGTRDGSSFTASQRGDVLYYKLTWQDASDHAAGLGFYWGATDGAAFKLTNSYTAYLAVEKEQAAKSRGFILPFNPNGGIITRIEAVETVVPAHDGAIYSLSGQRMNGAHLPAGVYVKNGKKLIIK